MRKYKHMPRRKKGYSAWYPRHIKPVRIGEYECVVIITSSAPSQLWDLEWDGKGFLVPFPMIVDYWRGLSEKGFKSAAKQEQEQ